MNTALIKKVLRATAFSLALSLVAATAHAHGKKEAGPNGGRLLTELTPHAEFFVTPERKVQITFLDAHDQPTAPASQVVTVTAGNRAAPTTLKFIRQGDVLLSDGVLPAGTEFPAVVQIKPTPDAKMIVAKFTLNLAMCDECKHAEYACTCDH